MFKVSYSNWAKLIHKGKEERPKTLDFYISKYEDRKKAHNPTGSKG